MFVVGVLEVGSESPDDVVEQASDLLADGAGGIELVGRGSGDDSPTASWEAEWDRLYEVVPAIATLGMPLSIVTAHPEVAGRSLADGSVAVTVDGSPSDEMWRAIAQSEVPIVLRARTTADDQVDHSVDGLVQLAEVLLATAERHGVRHRCVFDPGPALLPPADPSGDPSGDPGDLGQHVATVLRALRRFELPVSISVPTGSLQNADDLLELVVQHEPEFVRTDDPSAVRRIEQRLRS